MDAFIIWSGWGFALISAAYILVIERRARQESRKLDRLAESLAGTVDEPVLFGGDGLRSSPPGSIGNQPDQRLKSLLVGAAAGKQSLHQIESLASREGFSSGDVLKAVEVLSDRGLLQYSKPITEDSIIELRV